ncbi:MAG: energy-coupling factor ABC transporter permease [Candidatus Hydrothermarchaeales archaeon]
MHISDGILTLKWIVVWYLIAFVFLAIGLKVIRERTKNDDSYMPMLAVMGAAVFIISVWHFPVPVSGSSSHPIGTPMSAILVGGFPTVVLSTIALIFHMFLAHGGLTTLGANTVSMGIVGTFSGLLTYKALKKTNFSLPVAAGMAGFVGNLFTYAATSLELALNFAGTKSILTMWKIFMLGFAPTQIPLAFLELGFTAGMVQYLANSRPDILTKFIETSKEEITVG